MFQKLVQENKDLIARKKNEMVIEGKPLPDLTLMS